MLQEIRIKNFKSISDETLHLGRVNVFIGENGSGKSNILEAIAFVSAIENGKINIETLIEKGVRIAKPSLMTNSFFKTPQKHKIEFAVKANHSEIDFTIIPDKENIITTNWIDKEIVSAFVNLTNVYQNIDNDDLIADAISKLKNKKIQQGYFTKEYERSVTNYLIYSLSTPALRGLPKFQISDKLPVGTNGEGLDLLISTLDDEEKDILNRYNYLIDWLKEFDIDNEDKLKRQGYKLNRSKSNLYFTDKYMLSKNNIFSSENVNEGILHILFYLALITSKQTPAFFAIDNIETALNPHLCRHLIKEICNLTKERKKQILVTTHNPAVLDGLNLWDDDIRLFTVKRKNNGHTIAERIKLKPEHEKKEGKQLKLSELWTRGYLGAISNRF